MKRLLFALVLLLSSIVGKAQYYNATRTDVLGSVADNMFIGFTGSTASTCVPSSSTSFYGPISYPTAPPFYNNVSGVSWSGPTPSHFSTISIAHELSGGVLEYAAPISICSATFPISTTLYYPSSFTVGVDISTTSVPGELAVFIY